MLVKFRVVINENVSFTLIGGGGFTNNLTTKRDIVNKISGIVDITGMISKI